MSCNGCGRIDEQHGWFSYDDLISLWKLGSLLTICGKWGRKGPFYVVTVDTVDVSRNPHTMESMMEISE